MESKTSLRASVRSESARRGEKQLEEISERIMAAVERMDEFVRARDVAFYWALPDEVRTQAFAERWSGKKRLWLPVMRGDSLVLRRFTDKESLIPARFGILEPSSPEEIPVREVGLIVVPGMGFDAEGDRLGRGKGFYDRILCSDGPLKIGVCFDFQFFERIPTEPHDRYVDRVVCGSTAGTTVFVRHGMRSRTGKTNDTEPSGPRWENAVRIQPAPPSGSSKVSEFPDHLHRK